MNNGNLLSSLMGATGTGSVAAKSVTPQSRSDTSEKFQQTFDQVRPEVAARKPVARKEPERHSATEHRQTAVKSNSHPEPATYRATAESKKTAKVPETSEPVVTESRSKPAADKAVSEEVTSVAEDLVMGEELLVVDTGVDEIPVLPDLATLLATNEEILPQAVTADIPPTPTHTLLTDVETGLGENTSSLLLEVEGELAEDTDDVDLASIKPESDELSANPMLEIETPLVISSQPTPVLLEAEVADVGLMNPVASSTDPKAATLTAQVTQSAVAIDQPVLDKTPEQLLSPASVKTSEQFLAQEVLASRPVPIQPSSASFTPTLGNETNEAVNFADNPDFALLNSKADLNKIVEANFASMDKAAPAVELAKPAVPASVLEALARPLEIQSPAARAFVVQTGVPVTVGSPQWSQAVGDRVLWLAAQNVSAAEIRLDPPELGPMQVKVSITNDQASISFTSHNPMVRDALDQQLNRLREMFSEQGLNLVNVDVSDKSFAQQERDREEANKSRASADVDDEESIPVAITQAISMRLVDHYA